jgi:hypothetical protein
MGLMDYKWRNETTPELEKGQLLLVRLVANQQPLIHPLFECGRPLAPHIDRGGIERGPDVAGVEFLNHLDASAAVFGDLVDVGAFRQARQI